VKKTILISMLAVAMAACGSKQENVAASESKGAAPAGQATASDVQLPPGHPALGAGQPSAPAASGAAAPAAPAGNLISGKIAETMNAAGYTYVRVATGNGDLWAAVPQTQLKVGAPVNISAQMSMEKFESKTLNRTFDKIVFGTLNGPGSAPATPAATSPQSSMASAMGAQANAAGTAAQHITGGAANVGDVKVDKAPGGKSVAEAYAAKNDLKDKPVVIRGKVVKSLSGIMGKNWIHLRDGSGSKEKGDNDITVTSDDSAAVGDVVTVSGLLHLDKDFGRDTATR
jgi:hypothetical protein